MPLDTYKQKLFKESRAIIIYRHYPMKGEQKNYIYIIIRGTLQNNSNLEQAAELVQIKVLMHTKTFLRDCSKLHKPTPFTY